MIIITIANRKGGVAKTATSYALAAGLTAKGKKVLAIDLDGQHNLTTGTSADQNKPGSYEVLSGKATAAETIQHLQSFDIITATTELSTADARITDTGKEYRLKEALEAVADLYDYCVIDTPPALSILTTNALTACDGVIIPARTDEDSIEGIQQLYTSIQTIKKYCNPGIKIYGIVIAAYDHRTTLAKDMRDNIERLAAAIGTKVYSTVIRNNIAVQEAKAMRQSIYEYDKRSNGAADYAAFTAEVLNQTERGQ